ncbi:MAG: Smr/MutS family protein [Celeribacter sp.]|jgi:DNA-nicking Smr family endonuclease
MPRKPRDLRPDERDLWNRVARSTDPLHPNRRSVVKPAPPPEKPKAAPQTPAGDETESFLRAFTLGEKSQTRPAPNDLARPIGERVNSAPLRMDAKRFGKLKRGKVTPEARIDLHGLTLAQAHPRLTGFILDAQAQGRRLVLVITGKGRPGNGEGPIPSRTGALKHQVPQWLRMAPLAPLVLQVTQAHIRHGGAGAYYVYLRRNR